MTAEKNQRRKPMPSAYFVVRATVADSSQASGVRCLVFARAHA
jgi:hypothetical protein